MEKTPTPKSKFPTMDNSAATTAVNVSGTETGGKLVAKKGAQAGDPATQTVSRRTRVKATGKSGYGIKTTMPTYKDPQVGPTQGNGRLFTSSLNRTKPNFDAGMSNLD